MERGSSQVLCWHTTQSRQSCGQAERKLKELCLNICIHIQLLTPDFAACYHDMQFILHITKYLFIVLQCVYIYSQKFVSNVVWCLLLLMLKMAQTADSLSMRFQTNSHFGGDQEPIKIVLKLTVVQQFNVFSPCLNKKSLLWPGSKRAWVLLISLFMLDCLSSPPPKCTPYPEDVRIQGEKPGRRNRLQIRLPNETCLLAEMSC